MAAEKLTKARLIQIIVLMAVLVTAFVWRTVTYEDKSEAKGDAVQCEISPQSCKLEDKEQELALTLSPFPAKANTSLLLQISNTNVKPVASIEGIDMYMGVIPVTFEQQGNNWIGTFSVPACVHEEMQWGIKIKQGNKEIIAKFTVKK